MTRSIGRPLHVDLDQLSCTSGKRGFKTEAEARYRLSRAQEFRREDTGHVPGRVENKAYLCAACHAWHLAATINPRRVRATRDVRRNQRSGRR
jgi:hypothetical protein